MIANAQGINMKVLTKDLSGKLSLKVALSIVSDYISVDKVGGECDPIKTFEKCKAAAEHLDLSPTKMELDDRNRVPQNDPPYCYLENNQLKFNSRGSNTGKCGVAYLGKAENKDTCLCKKGK